MMRKASLFGIIGTIILFISMIIETITYDLDNPTLILIRLLLPISVLLFIINFKNRMKNERN